MTLWLSLLCALQDGATPLGLAVRGSHDAVVRALVAAGADATGPLYDACASGDTPIVNMLLSAPGVNPNTAREVRFNGVLVIACKFHPLRSTISVVAYVAKPDGEVSGGGVG